MLGMGFVKNWSGLMAARWFLGLTEAGLFPGINYYLSCWYKRSEFGVRAVSVLATTILTAAITRLTETHRPSSSQPLLSRDPLVASSRQLSKRWTVLVDNLVGPGSLSSKAF